MMLCPQAWPISGRASYSARTAMVRPLPEPVVARRVVSTPYSPVSTSMPRAPSTDLVVGLSIEGGLEADLKWERAAGKRWRGEDSDKSAEMSTSLHIGLRGSVEVTARMFYVKAKAGVEIKLQGARKDSEGIGAVMNFWATTANDKPRLGGRVDFTGAAIYYAYYAELGAAEVETEDDDDVPRGRGSARDLAGEAKVDEKVMNKLVDIFRPRQWPVQPDRDAIDELTL